MRTDLVKVLQHENTILKRFRNVLQNTNCNIDLTKLLFTMRSQESMRRELHTCE